MKRNIRNRAIRQQISESLKDITQFCARFNNFRNISNSTVYLAIVCQCRGAEHSP